ncbi:MAG TPA: DUF4388 domain-containing protein [Anaerolineales bacterium]|nr:DUF4388 domain-containing protein [Anaerolineales bacterium]
MALQGNLRDFSIFQLLNLINLTRKTGTLNLRNNQEQSCLIFKEGKLIYAEIDSEGGALPRVLFKGGKLTKQQASALAARANKINDQELALLLVNARYVTQSDIQECIRKHGLEIISRLFSWNGGQFEFIANQMARDGFVQVPVELDAVIMEGTRRQKETERLKEELPDLDNTALQFTDRPDTRLRGVNLSVDEWKVVSFVNQRNSIRQIARANNMDDLRIRKIVYSLLQAGLIQIVPLAINNTVARQPVKPVDKAQKRGLVNRIIDRIRSL